jgi:hypothetical protein
MLQQITKENFYQVLGRFTTSELESLLQRSPYFQQAHLLLAKKYQLENDPRFDQQLQLAALYTQDRELLFTLFTEARQVITQPEVIPVQKVAESQPVEDMVIETVPEQPLTTTSDFTVHETITAEPLDNQAINSTDYKEAAELPVVDEEQQIQISEPEEVQPENVVSAQTYIDEEIHHDPTDIEQTEQAEEDQHEQPISLAGSHTFDEWLTAFKNKPLKVTADTDIKQEQPVDDELDKLITENVSVDYLHELVTEETQYSKGLDKFIEEQIQKHKQTEPPKRTAENEISADLITETMAKVYEMQKKYTKAIKAYEVLALKIPEKSSLFAARINYLKNLI